MPLSNKDSSKPVHYPKNPDKFEFDEEVAAIFDNMASRSIPLYKDAHRVHAMLAATHLTQQFNLVQRKECHILDVGASVGGFLEALCNRFQNNPEIGIPGVTYQATDESECMMAEFEHRYPWAAGTVCTADTPQGFRDHFDIAVLMYVLQFIPEWERDDVLHEIWKSMRPGAIIFLGQKELVDESIRPVYTFEYIRWRMDNGYSQEEIAEKTRALESVMWPEPIDKTIDRLERVGFKHVRETTRWLMFSTLMARR